MKKFISVFLVLGVLLTALPFGASAAEIEATTTQNFSKISAGYLHAAAVHANGTLWAWGWNAPGQLGDGTTIDRHHPVQIGVDRDWAYVSAGAFHTMAIKTDGTLWGWGANIFGGSATARQLIDTRPHE